MGAPQATSLHRGLQILLALGSEDALDNGGLGVVQVAERTGHDKSQVSRTFKALASSGLVERDPDSLAYRLGWRLFTLAARAADQRLLEVASPLLLRLIKDVGERAHLSVLQGSEVLTLLSQSPTHAVQAAGWVGRTVPAYCTSAGRALLIDFDKEELAALLDGVEWQSKGPNAPRDVDELDARLAVCRTQGWAFSDEEFEAGLVGIAAPVRDFRGRVTASLNVSAPKFRLKGRVEDTALRTKSAADELTMRLSASIDPDDQAGYESMQ
ncbi:MAG: IclR family transcriptional regulator [Actinomycetota bacterium]|nr:IclR family transcriptional regulator [Actinomycetota bacterium]